MGVDVTDNAQLTAILQKKEGSEEVQSLTLDSMDEASLLKYSADSQVRRQYFSAFCNFAKDVNLGNVT